MKNENTYSEKVTGEKAFFSTVSEMRFDDLGFNHPSIDLRRAVKAGKQIVKSPYKWMNDAFYDGWYLKWLPQFRKKRSIINEAVVYDGCIIIDICCGSGSFSLEMAKKGGAVLGLDLCEKSIEIANLAKKNAKKEIKGSLKYEIADIHNKIDEIEGPIDCVTMVAAIHHLPGGEELVEKIYNLLKPGGKLLIIDHFEDVSRLNSTFEQLFTLLIPSGYITLREKMALLFLRGSISKLFLLTFGFLLPNQISFLNRIKYLILTLFQFLSQNWEHKKKNLENSILEEINLIDQRFNKKGTTFLSTSPFDDSCEFEDYKSKIDKLFSNVVIKDINAFNTQKIILEIPFTLPDFFRRSIALFFSYIDNIFCSLKLIKGHEILMIAKK